MKCQQSFTLCLDSFATQEYFQASTIKEYNCNLDWLVHQSSHLNTRDKTAQLFRNMALLYYG